MPYDTVVNKTIEYLGVPSVVGHEKFFINFLTKDFENLGLNVTEHEGILEISGRKPHSSIISAHLDRHGLISMGDGHYSYAAEYIKEKKYHEYSKPTHDMLRAIGNRFKGEKVFAYDPKNGDRIAKGVISLHDPQMINENCIFEVDSMEDMPKNIPLAYARTAVSDGTNLKGQLDNVISLGTIYALFQNGFQGTALLTCEEEIGKSWVHILDWLEKHNVETKKLIIIDTSPFREPDPADAGQITLRHCDKSADFDEVFTQKIKQRCIDLLIPFQFKDEYLRAIGVEKYGLGSTELGRIIQNSDGRWSGTTVQIPTTEYHTSYETTSRSSIESYYALLHSILVSDKII